MTTAAKTTQAPSPRVPRWSDVAELTVSTGFPCVTITMPTRPAARMTSPDRRALDALVHEAEQVLGATGLTNVGPTLSALGELAAAAFDSQTGQALVLCASRAVQRAYRLPHPSAQRVVVEASFATRDLVAALHRTPPHLLLTLHPDAAHLYEVQSHVPLRRATVHLRDVTSTAADPADPDEVSRLVTETFLSDVEAELARQRVRFPSPLVIAGTPRLMDRFIQRSRQCHRLAGLVDTAHAQTPDELMRRSAASLEDYLRSRQADALTLVRRAEADGGHRIASGIEAAWQCARRGRPRMLVVEQSYSVPGKVGGHPLEPWAYRPGDPGHLHDLVDDLVEEVIRRGGQVALVEDGSLSDHDRVALVTGERAA